MRLIACLVIRHDTDVIDTYVSHLLRQGFDGFAIIDHRADSEAIRAAVERNGAEAIVRRRESSDFPQGVWTTELAHLARTELGADWVFPLDADEFIFPTRLHDVRSVMEVLPSTTTALSIRRFNMLPPVWPRAFPAGMRRRLRHELNFDGRRLPPKVAARAVPDLRIADGNHQAYGVDAPDPTRDGLEILHAPFRSWQQFMSKVSVGADAIRMTAGLGPNTGRHWLELERAGTSRRRFRQALPLLADTPVRRLRSRLAGAHVRDDRLASIVQS